MAVLTILRYPDPRLHQVAAPVTEFDDGLRQLVRDMAETMYAAPGIGLAAPQIGVASRVIVIDLAEKESQRQPLRMANPEVVSVSEDSQVFEEGCLSLPDQYAEVERPAIVHARWIDETGAKHEEKLEGMLATCLQHEMDHLEGILFIDHLSRLKRQMVLKKLEKQRKTVA